MAIGYRPPNNLSIPFKFTQTGYQPPDWNAIPFVFTSKQEAIGNLRAAINVMTAEPDNYQQTTYTYLKYCEEYIIGYQQYNTQILRGKCHYGGIRDLGTFIEVWEKLIYSETKDLSAKTKGVYSETKDLPAIMSGEPPKDLPAYINVFQRLIKDLPASIRGWKKEDLSAQINSMITASLPAYIVAVPPVDLPAYIKPWPMKQLPANIYGWGRMDLAAALYAMQKGDLPAIINVVPPIDLGAILKGWVREATKDLPAYIDGFAYADLPAIIRAKYFKDLPAYIYATAPIDLGALIHGWQEANLTASLIGVYGAYDLRASIVATENYRDLLAYINPFTATKFPTDLPASIRGWYSSSISAYINAISAVDLAASITSIGQVGDLHATILPKTIRLTSVLDVITMAHSDLSAVINASCIWSEFKNLSAYINTVYKSDLTANITGKKYSTVTANLGARYGYVDTYSYIDKLPLSISIATETYRYIDQLPLLIKIFTSQYDLGAGITGTYRYNDLAAAITAVYLEPHHFDNTKNKERFYNTDYAGFFASLQLVEISFKSIVRDYFYSSLGAEAWKVDRADKWIADVAAYIPANTAINVKRKLHRIKSLSDISKYESIDEAVRVAIDYVTGYPYDDIPAYINPHGGFLNLRAMVSGRGTTSTNNDLAAAITGEITGIKVVGKEDGIEIF